MKGRVRINMFNVCMNETLRVNKKECMTSEKATSCGLSRLPINGTMILTSKFEV